MFKLKSIKEEGAEAIIEDIMTENFPKLKAPRYRFKKAL